MAEFFTELDEHGCAEVCLLFLLLGTRVTPVLSSLCNFQSAEKTLLHRNISQGMVGLFKKHNYTSCPQNANPDENSLKPTKERTTQ